jgi:predicted aconitase
VCAAIVGRVPEYGLLLDEPRRGQVLVRVRAALDGSFDIGLLGAHLGAVLRDRIPVLEGLPLDSLPADLRYLGAALSVTGAVSLFHAVGLTPECLTADAAFGGARPDEEMTVTDEDLAGTRASLTMFEGPFDLVMLGNPQYTYQEIMAVAGWLSGRRVSPHVEFYVCTNGLQRLLAARMGAVEAIERAGGQVVDICGCGIRETRLGRHAPRPIDRLVTDGVKSALYIRDAGRTQVVAAPAKACVEAAVRGVC